MTGGNRLSRKALGWGGMKGMKWDGRVGRVGVGKKEWKGDGEAVVLCKAAFGGKEDWQNA